jgi:hypothetical protein
MSEPVMVARLSSILRITAMYPETSQELLPLPEPGSMSSLALSMKNRHDWWRTFCGSRA